jgi:phage baseplate assembly protein V
MSRKTPLAETLQEYAVTLHRGLVHEIDPDTHRIKAILPDWDDMVTHWLDIPEKGTQDDKVINTIDKGAQVALLLTAGATEGVVLGFIYSEEDEPPVTSGDRWHRTFKDGTVLEYDRAAHKLTVDAKGEIEIEATGPVKIKGLQDLTIEALTVNVKAQTLAKIEAPVIELKAPVVKTGPQLVEGLISFIPPTP